MEPASSAPMRAPPRSRVCGRSPGSTVCGRSSSRRSTATRRACSTLRWGRPTPWASAPWRSSSMRTRWWAPATAGRLLSTGTRCWSHRASELRSRTVVPTWHWSAWWNTSSRGPPIRRRRHRRESVLHWRRPPGARRSGSPESLRPARSLPPSADISLTIYSVIASLRRLWSAGTDDLQDLSAIAGDLALADPGNGQEAACIRGPARGDCRQGLIVGDHVGGHAIRAGALATPLDEALEQRLVGRGELETGACCRGGSLRRGVGDGIRPQLGNEARGACPRRRPLHSHPVVRPGDHEVTPGTGDPDVEEPALLGERGEVGGRLANREGALLELREE